MRIKIVTSLCLPSKFVRNVNRMKGDLCVCKEWILNKNNVFQVQTTASIYNRFSDHLLFCQCRCVWSHRCKWKQTYNPHKVIHTTPAHQLTSCEVKSCIFVRKKPCRHFRIGWNTSPLSIIFLSPVKKSSRLNRERHMQRSKESKTLLNKYCHAFISCLDSRTHF